MKNLRISWEAFLLTFCLCFGLLPGALAQTSQSQRIAHGAYLVEGLGHCGACHTPRGIAFQEKAYSADDPLYLAGAVVENWVATSLRDSVMSQDEIVDLLQKGISKSKGIAGPMREVITESTQFLSDEDLQSIAAYLVFIQRVPPQEKEAIDSTVDEQAQALYMDYCSTCHGAKGAGTAPAVPALAGNSNVVSSDPRNLIHILYDGASTPDLTTHKGYVMPGYKDILSEQELLSLINYVRQAWGNQAKTVSPQELKKIRP